MADSPKNSFDLFFEKAAQDPALEGEFRGWVARQEFVIPAEEAASSLSSGSRQIDLTPATRLRLKAFQTPQGMAVPLFSDLGRFEAWSAADPAGRFVKLKGSDLARITPQGAAWLLNPGSERFSKWFTPDEVLQQR